MGCGVGDPPNANKVLKKKKKKNTYKWARDIFLLVIRVQIARKSVESDAKL